MQKGIMMAFVDNDRRELSVQVWDDDVLGQSSDVVLGISKANKKNVNNKSLVPFTILLLYYFGIKPNDNAKLISERKQIL